MVVIFILPWEAVFSIVHFLQTCSFNVIRELQLLYFDSNFILRSVLSFNFQLSNASLMCIAIAVLRASSSGAKNGE